ncbi:MAG: response regulator transcription factor [Cyclobacteriaceae bacterium]|nr:response regulator transcription factor [Cyclobacteriaceae bacterium]
MPIRILTYEDNQQLRESVVAMLSLSTDFILVGSFGDVLKVEQQVKELKPDLILMDIDLPGMNGIEAVKKVRLFNAWVHIIMLTVFDDNKHVVDAICAGASGYLLKMHIPEKLMESVNEVIQGGAPMSPGIARMVIAKLQQLPEQSNTYQLTAREKEILSSLSKGNSYKLIAAQFNISIDTVRTHIKHIYDKLQVRSQTEAVSKAIHEKLV